MIRAATANDIAELRAMIRELADYERAADQARASDEQLHEALFGEHPAAFVLIAEDDHTGEPVGYALWFPRFSTWTGARGMHLEDLNVRSHARGGGHGKASAGRSCRDLPTARLRGLRMVGAGVE
ncbi:N-acetyltransferase family protein [Amycolatopsis sp. YIM 10]|uniref:GNAT family N-acetyltransferase n=1 Tax=Amycolatopsis sp. YIM 10 TaxID=2653857 RepID=UPI00351AA612